MVGKLHEYPRRIAFSEGTHTIFGQGSRFARWLCHCAANTITHFLIPFVTGEVLRRCHCKVRQHFPEPSIYIACCVVKVSRRCTWVLVGSVGDSFKTDPQNEVKKSS